MPIPGPRIAPAAARLAAVHAWECWVDPYEGGGIRCIADRDVLRPLPAEFTDDDEAAEVLLELVHDHLHGARLQRACDLVRERSYLLRRGDLWTISLNGPPLESSWNVAKPQLLVRTLLCRDRPGCAIRFHR